MKNFDFNRVWESYVSSKISLSQKCVFNIFGLIIHIHIVQKLLKFYLNTLTFMVIRMEIVDKYFKVGYVSGTKRDL